MRIQLIAILSFCCFLFIKGQEPAPINVLFVLDASSSMLKKWGKEDKWTTAEKSLLLITDSLLKEHPNLNFGLRVYGHQSLSSENDCQDTELKLPIARHTKAALKDRLISVKPKGITPLAFTLEQTNQDFAGLEGQKNILILITDGSESCQGDPCKILKILLSKEVIVKPVIIGLDIDIESLKEYDCVQDIFNPHSAFEFQKNILNVLKQAINFTTLQVNLLDENKKNSQTNIPLIFFSNSNLPDYSFYHKMNKQGNPDTLLLEPTPTYRLEVQTIPTIIIKGINLSANKHNTINVPAPTSALTIKTLVEQDAITLVKELPYFIKINKEIDYIYSSFTNKTQEYLYGTYDIDILTLPITRLKAVRLDEEEKTIEIPVPGKLKLSSKFPIHGALFAEINKELVNIYAFKTNSTQEILDLQPGSYTIVYRFNHKRKMIETAQENIVIKSKEIVEIKL